MATGRRFSQTYHKRIMYQQQEHVLIDYIPVSTSILDSSNESMLRGVKHQGQRGVDFHKHIRYQ